MKIPTSFKLFGQTIKVLFLPERFTEGQEGHYGFSSYRRNEIHLRPSTSTHPITDDQMEQVFWHELTHFILYWAGPAYSAKTDYMHQDEGFVDLVSCLLHQAVSTFEFDLA